MKPILNNPYRIAGILSNANERALIKQKTKTQRYLEVGKEVSSEYDFTILGTFARNKENVNKAFANIEQSQDKVFHALFWFVAINPIDNIALQHLNNNDEAKTLEIFEKVTKDREISKSNFSAFHNLSTLKLLSSEKYEQKDGIKTKIKLIKSPLFKNFIAEVADETYILEEDKIINKFIDTILSMDRMSASKANILALFEECDKDIINRVANKLADTHILCIENEIEKATNSREESRKTGDTIAKALINNTRFHLANIKKVKGKDDFNYKTLADKIANEVSKCSVAFFNYHQEAESDFNYLETSIELVKMAISVAQGSLMIQELKENLNTLENYRDQTLNQVIECLQSIKDQYMELADEIGYSEIIRHKFGTGYSLASTVFWVKTTEFIKSTISKRNIENIKQSEAIDKVETYKELVSFIFSHLSYSLKKEIAYIRFWDTYIKEPQSINKETAQEGEHNSINSRIKTIGIIILIILLIKACMQITS